MFASHRIIGMVPTKKKTNDNLNDCGCVHKSNNKKTPKFMHTFTFDGNKNSQGIFNFYFI